VPLTLDVLENTGQKINLKDRKYTN